MKTIMYPAISLDGFIAKPDGDSFSWVNQEDEARYDEAVKRYGCVLAGHKTYEEYKEDLLNHLSEIKKRKDYQNASDKEEF